MKFHHTCSADTPSTDFPFTIKNWPTYSDFAAGTLNNMKDTYWVLPIPAYKQGGGLMYPTMYKHQLVGVTVILNFTLTHWFIPVKPGQMQEVSDIYSAELLGMHASKKSKNGNWLSGEF